jgi:asparagine N-glycosylation enzyme membrane subunit Stt3
MMERVQELFTYNDERLSTKNIILLTILAYTVAVLLKVVLYYLQVSGHDEFMHNGNPIAIWTPDSGLYGFYAQELLRGVNYPLVAEYMPGYLLYWVHKVSGISIEAIIYWLPAFLTSLVVFPLMFAGWASRLVWVFFFASIVTVSSLGYYERTYLGYYDPDNLNLFFMLAVLSGLFAVASRKRHGWVLISALFMVGFEYWYHSAKPLMAGILVSYLVYSVVLDRKNIANYKAFIIMALVIIPLEPMLKYLVMGVLYLLFFVNLRIDYRIIWAVFGVAGFFAYEYIDINKYYSRAMEYFSKTTFDSRGSAEGSLAFMSTIGTVQEAQTLGLSSIGIKLLNIPYLFLLSGIGYFLFIFWRRELLIFIPLFALSIAGYFAGARFVYYATPVYAIGLFYLIVVLRNIYEMIREKNGAVFQAVVSSVAVFFIVIALLVMISRPLGQIFTSDTLSGFDNLKNESKRGDFIVTWWDYGWPLWHYTGLNTIIDGGIHHTDNYIVSKILLSDSQSFSANAARFIAEEQAKLGPDTLGKVFSSRSPESIMGMLKSENFDLEKNRDVFIYLDKDMLTKVSTMYKFGNIDLKNGKQLSSFVYADFIIMETEGGVFYCRSIRGGEGMSFDTSSGVLKMGKDEAVVNTFFNFKNSELISESSYSSDGRLYIIKYDNLMLLMDRRLLDSLFIQAFIFDEVDSEYFNIVYKNRDSMMLKVK